MPNAIICMRPACHNLILDLEQAHGLERFTYSAKRGVPRKQTLDDYLCPVCNDQLNHWLGLDDKGAPQRVIERYNHALASEERAQGEQDSAPVRAMPEGVRGDEGGY